MYLCADSQEPLSFRKHAIADNCTYNGINERVSVVLRKGKKNLHREKHLVWVLRR